LQNFRRPTAPASETSADAFVVLCRDLKLFSQAIVAIDSSKFKAVNSRDRNFTPGKIDKRQEQIEQSVQRYFGRPGDCRSHTACGDRSTNRTTAGEDQKAAPADAPA